MYRISVAEIEIYNGRKFYDGKKINEEATLHMSLEQYQSGWLVSRKALIIQPILGPEKIIKARKSVKRAANSIRSFRS